MPSELYRTYEVLIEESVHPTHPKRGKTKKTEGYKPDVHQALVTSNELFQDAVCYYTLMLAGLAGEAKNKKGRLLNPLWQEFTKGKFKDQAQKVIRRFANRYAACNGLTDPSGLLEKFLFSSEVARSVAEFNKAQIANDTYRVVEQQAVKTDEDGEIEESEALNEFASGWTSILCDPENETNIPGTGILDQMHRDVLADSAKLDAAIDEAFQEASQWCRDSAEKKEQAKLAAMVRKRDETMAKAKTEKARLKKRDEWQAKIEQEKTARTGAKEENAKNAENALTTLRDALADGLRYDEQKHNHTSEAHAAIEETLREVAARISSSTPGINRIRYGSRDNSFEGVLLRYWWLHRCGASDAGVTGAALAAAKAAVKKDLDLYLKDAAQAPKQPPTLNERSITDAPFAATHKCAFPMFLKGVPGIAHKDRSPWWDFDKAAFMYAADDVFKFKRRTQERQDRFNRLNCLVQLGEGQDGIHELQPENSPTGKKLTVKGMKSDPRRSKIIALLNGLASDKGFEGGYGLRPGTIGGWADVREAFLELEAKASNQSRKLTADELLAAVDKCREENRQGFGSADLFHELCAPDYHLIWSKSGEQTEQANANQIGDFVAYYVRFLEWKDEVAGLQELDAERKAKKDDSGNVILRPISYTFPGLENRHGEISQRHFNFKANLNEEFTFEKLFTKEASDGSNTYRLVESPESRTVKLAARRLKRDKIMTSGGQSVNALWCPPLVFGMGQKPVAGKKKKKGGEGKPLKVSFSLVVDMEQALDDWRTVHLKVQLPVSFTELNNTTRSEKKDWGGSFEWNKDGMGRFFRWPIDRLSKALAAVAALKGHPTWENQKEAVDAFLAGISAQTTNAQGKALAKAIEDAAKDVKDARNKQMVETAAKALKALGEKVWCQEKDNNPTILSVDLGNRFCAAFARLQVHRDTTAENRGRVISPDNEWNEPIYARIAEHGTLRLQGEDAWVWAHQRDQDGGCVKDSAGEFVYEKRKEEYGNHGRGRFPKADEIAKFEALADAILPIDRTPIRAVETMTVPEMGDHLLWRLRRRISRTRNLFKLRWSIHPDAKKRDPNTGHYDQDFDPRERDEQRSMVLQTLARNYTRPKREEDEKEDSVQERLRLRLATEPEWKAKFAEVIVEAETEPKGKAKSKKKSKDAVREICRGWKIPETKWNDFRTLLETELAAMLDPRRLESLTGNWKTFGEPGERNAWQMLRSSLESGRTTVGNFTHPLSSTSLLLCAAMEWCLPLRKRHWHWRADAKEPKLFMGKHGPKDDDCEAPQHIPLIQGMRGLALRRLEQVLNLRQICQSFAKIERRWLQGGHGVNDLVIKRDDELHDPCPDLLKKSNDLREQRVYQTAHLILTEALGLQLKNPAKVGRDGKTKKELKSEIDLHGDYEPKQLNGKDAPRCSVIVLEDLSRYRTSQERTRSENSRLMEWAHRKIINKLADMAKPFGITLMLVDPAWSSRFDSRTGVAGIRVKEVKRDFENEMPFVAWRKRVKADGKPDELATLVENMITRFNGIPVDSEKDRTRTLVLPIEGGELFLPTKAPADGKDGIINADENAAVNIGLRALAHPDRLDIFPRFRTVKKANGTVRVRNRRGYFASLPEDDAGRELRVDWSQETAPKTTPNESIGDEVDEVAAESSEYPDYFAVLPHTTDFGVRCADKCHQSNGVVRQRLSDFTAYERPLFLKRVQQICSQRMGDINAARCETWRS
jgi:IS605 OrfB family transposase